MKKNCKLVALVPARGGSKGVKRKNVRNVGGKPLIAWTIEAAKKSIEVDKIIVTTDDNEISDISIRFGAEVILRPKELAGDRTQMIEVVQHALDKLESIGECYEYLLLLQPTAPSRIAKDIDEAYRFIKQYQADSLISVNVDIDKHPARCYRIIDNRLSRYEPEPHGNLRQDLPNVYHRNGAIYIIRIDYINTYGELWSDKPLAYIMPKERSINIDDEFDLLMADLLLTHQQKDTKEILRNSTNGNVQIEK